MHAASNWGVLPLSFAILVKPGPFFHYEWQFSWVKGHVVRNVGLCTPRIWPV